MWPAPAHPPPEAGLQMAHAHPPEAWAIAFSLLQQHVVDEPHTFDGRGHECQRASLGGIYFT
ncbi:Uncharacterised protein [Corynebacterium renale]|nr:Uncharacterised protein [Corynebacterium renale]